MTDRSRLELTDDFIERMVAERAGSRAPSDLIDVVMSATAVTSQRRAPLLPAITLPRRMGSRPALVVIGMLLALLALGAALVGSAPARSDPLPTTLESSWSSVGNREFPIRNGNHSDIVNAGVNIRIGSAGIDIPNLWTDLPSTASLAGPDTIDVRTASTWPTWDCGPGVASTYVFSVSESGRTLTLTPLRDDCPTRATILKGDWIRTEIGDLDAGRHAPALFRPFGGESGTFAYTVPAGWANGGECADCFFLSRTGGPGPTGVSLFADVVPSTQTGVGCVVSNPGDKPTPAAIAAWLATLDGIVVTHAKPVVIGGLSGVSVDASHAPGWVNPCSLGAARDIFADPRDMSPTVYVEDESMTRYFILDRGEGQILLIYLQSQAPETWDAAIAAAMPVIQSFEFTR